jgi:transposase
MHRPSPVSEQQMQRILAFTHSETRMTFQEFLSKWDVTHDFLAELFQCDVSTVKRWIKGKFDDSSSQRSHQFGVKTRYAQNLSRRKVL